MSLSRTNTSLFLSILRVLKLISFFSLEMASRRLSAMTRSERDRIRWRNKSFAELFIDRMRSTNDLLVNVIYLDFNALSFTTKLVSK